MTIMVSALFFSFTVPHPSAFVDFALAVLYLFYVSVLQPAAALPAALPACLPKSSVFYTYLLHVSIELPTSAHL